MKSTSLLFLLAAIAGPIAYAEPWIKHDGDEILMMTEADCYAAGFCDQNNQNLLEGWVQVSKEDYRLAGSRYAKFEGGRVVEMNPVEKAAQDILAAQANEALEIAAHNAIVDQAKAEVDSPKTIPAMLNVCISAITTDEIREIKKGTPRTGKTDAQLKQTVKACLDTLKR